MFFFGTIRRWLRDRGRLLFRYHDGRRWRRADPVAVGRFLEQAEPEYLDLLRTLHRPPAAPPGPVGDAIRGQIRDAELRMVALARRAFDMPPPKRPPQLEPGETADGEALAVLVGYFAYMEDLADEASFTSTPPGPESAPPTASPTEPSPASGGAAA